MTQQYLLLEKSRSESKTRRSLYNRIKLAISDNEIAALKRFVYRYEQLQITPNVDADRVKQTRCSRLQPRGGQLL